MRHVFRTLTPLLLLVVAALPVAGEISPEAQKYFDKMAGLYDAGPFKVSYTASGQQMGMAMSLEGKLLYADADRMRMDATMAMKMGDQDMNMSMLMVKDGSTMWTEMDNPMMAGQKQVMKVNVDDLDKLAAMGGGVGLGGNPSNMDPRAQLEAMAKSFDIDIKEVAGGRVTLTAAMTGEAKQKIEGTPAAAAMTGNMEIVLDEATGFPVEMRIGDAFTIRYGKPEMLDEGALDPTDFSYTPPEGATVIDLGKMAGAMSGQQE